MKGLLRRRLLFWAPWIALAILGAVSLGDLVRETLAEARAGLPLVGIVINFIMRFIPIGLLFFALGIVIEVVEQEYRAGRMDRRVRRLLFWTPRIAALSFAAFVSLFALDVFALGYGLLETLLALLIHLVPVAIVLAGIAIAWRWEWIGAVVFIGWAIWYVAAFRGFPFSVYLALAGLPFVLGVLFLLNWRYRAELRSGS